MKQEILDHRNILTNMPQKYYWFDDNPALTNFMMALSSLFPAGESFFMKSITAYLKDVPQHKSDITVFCKQERNHSQVHSKLNRLHNRHAVQKLDVLTGKLLDIVTKFTNKKQRLISTVVLEHATATLAQRLLDNPVLLGMMEKEARELWVYHAIEETGELHSSIATKVYNDVARSSTSQLEYNTIKAITLVALAVVIVCYQSYLTLVDGNLYGYSDLAYILFNRDNGVIGSNFLQYFE